MGTLWLADLDRVLAPLGVDTYPGWETRSRSSGGYDGVFGVAVHHTASSASPGSDMAYMWENCEDRPVGAIYLARDGQVTVGAAGATNCQGKGGPLTTSSGTIPKDKGNCFLIAVEAANAGTGEAWPTVQQDSYVLLVGLLCDAYGLAPGDVFGHYDYCQPSCPGRKVDPAGPSRFGAVNPSGTWDIARFRGELIPIPPTPITPEDDMTEDDWKRMEKLVADKCDLVLRQEFAPSGECYHRLEKLVADELRQADL